MGLLRWLAERQKVEIPWGKTIMTFEIGFACALPLLQFRLLTISIVAVLAVFFLLFPRHRRRRWFIPAVIVVAISMFLPFDVAIGSFHYGSRTGTSPGAPHFVRFVVGLPMHTQLIEHYGEYISGGCTWPVLYPPRWILVWN